MKLHEIRTFVLAVQLGSFSKVADVLFMTQPSVSKYISALEMEVGKPLFIREPHMLELTEFGKQFLPYAEAIIQAESNAQNFLGMQDQKPSMFLSLDISATTGTAGDGTLMQCINQGITAFRKQHAEAYVSIRLTPDRELVELVTSKKTNLALCTQARFGDNAAAANDVCKLVLGPQKNYIIYSPEMGKFQSLDALLEKERPLSHIHDLVNLDLVALLRVGRQTSMPLRPCINWYSVMANVVQNNSIGLIPASMLEQAYRNGLRAIPLQEAQFETVLCLYLADHADRKSYVQGLGECIRQAITECGGEEAQ